MKPAPPVTKIVVSSKRIGGLAIHGLRRIEAAVNIHQIAPVAALGTFLRQPIEMIERDIAEPKRNLFGTGYAHALPLLKDLNKMARLDERGMGAGVEPGEPAAEHFHEQIATLHVGTI